MKNKPIYSGKTLPEIEIKSKKVPTKTIIYEPIIRKLYSTINPTTKEKIILPEDQYKELTNTEYYRNLPKDHWYKNWRSNVWMNPPKKYRIGGRISRKDKISRIEWERKYGKLKIPRFEYGKVSHLGNSYKMVTTLEYDPINGNIINYYNKGGQLNPFIEEKPKSKNQRKIEELQAGLKPRNNDYTYEFENQVNTIPLKDRLKILKKISKYTIKHRGETTPSFNPINSNQQRSKCTGDGETVSKPIKYNKGGELDLQPQDAKRDNTNVQLPYKNIDFRKTKSQYTKSIMPAKIFIKDDRVIDGVTGNPVKSNMKFTGNYDIETIQEIIDVTRRYNDNLTKEGNTHLKHDIPTVLAIALQESNLGNKNYNNPMHYLYPELSEDITSEGSIWNSLEVLTEAKRRGIKLGDPTEAHILQRYNSYDLDKTLTNKSEYGANSYYGVPTPINLRDNPVYGKRVINLRDSVLMKNKRIKNLIGKDKYSKGGKIKIKQDIDSTYLANRNVPFIKRILDGNKDSIPFGKDYATHRMAYSEADGKYYVYPEVEFYDGKLTNLPDINVNPFDYNFENKNVIEFDSKGDARRFSRRYKKSSYWKP